jgi:Xaa-Pro aminopeptidase
MRVVQPAVLVGPYDWDEALVPRAEFDARRKEVLGKIAGSGLSGLVVYGNKIDNAALAYLTHFTPKLDAAFALIAPDGSVRLHSAGSPQMMVNAQRLTWVEGVKPLRDAGKHIAEWAEALAPGPLGLWTTETMPADLLPRLQAALPSRPLRDVGAQLDPVLCTKSPVARRLIQGACAMLGASSAALRQAFRDGATSRDAVVAAEKAAAAAGAQDIRVLASLSKGGTPTAIDYPQSAKLDALLTYLAVRHAGYWADGFLTLSASPSSTLTRAQDALKAMIATARIGASVAELKQAAEAKLAGLASHPLARKLVSGIGLALEETEAELGGVTRLEAGRIYTLRSGARQSETDNALVSAMIEPKAGGVEILWSSLA